MLHNNTRNIDLATTLFLSQKKKKSESPDHLRQPVNQLTDQVQSSIHTAVLLILIWRSLMLTSILASAHHEIDLSVQELRAPVCLYYK